MKYYHIIAHPLDNFRTLEDALRYYSNYGLHPKIPMSAQAPEDITTPRVCLGGSVEQCLTSIGLTLGPAPLYPIIVLGFELSASEVYFPSSSQVPDVDFTDEVWSLKPVVPEIVQLRWLGQNSILRKKISRPDGTPMFMVTAVKYLSEDEVALLQELQGRRDLLQEIEESDGTFVVPQSMSRGGCMRSPDCIDADGEVTKLNRMNLD